MALNANVVWEVRTDGDDNNGGGFNSSSSGTDYSQQPTAELSVTDATTSGIGVTTLTSTTGGFTSQMVGNVIHLYSGTNLTAGWYEITAYTDGNTVTLDRAPDDGVGGVSGATCKVGGCFASPGGLGAALANAFVSGHRAWMKSGTYTITSDSVNVSGGQFQLLQTGIFVLEGYGATRGDGTRPLINKTIGLSGSGTQYMIALYGGSSTGTQRCRYLKCDATGYENNTRLFSKISSYGASTDYCIAVGGLYGFYGVRTFKCYSEASKYGFYTGPAVSCVAKSCTTYGFFRGEFTKCIAWSCNIGFSNYYAANHKLCMAYDCTSHGFIAEAVMTLTDCLAVNNGGYGFANTTNKHASLIGCCGYNNTSGNFQITPDPDETIAITGDPFVSASTGDFRLNNTAGAGAVLRGAGLGVYGQTDNQDVGAVQHSDTTKITYKGGVSHSTY